MKTRKALWISLAVVFGVLTVGMSVGTGFAFKYETVINQVLHIEANTHTGGSSDANYFKADFKKAAEQSEDAKKVCQEVEEEGITLLKNEGVLPLKTGSKVTLLGQTSEDFISGGTGSSASSKSKDTVESSLKDAGLVVNPTMVDFYRNGNGKNYRRVGLEGALNNVIKDNGTGRIHEVPMSAYSDNEWNSVSNYGDAAIIMIGRQSGEGGDIPFFGAKEDGYVQGNQLELTKEERELFAKAKSLKDAGKVKKIVAVFNTSNPLELDFLNPSICGTDYGIDAAMYIGLTGSTGIKALGEVLVGAVNPSGRLPDTWAYDNLTTPAMQNTYITAYTNSAEKGLAYDGQYNTYYEAYQEGIYVGYKYYETRYEDAVLGTANVGSYDYASMVAYPFGYGLSYTDFSYSNLQVLEGEKDITVTLNVHNNGAVDGKHAVEVFLQRPYTDYDKAHGIEQSAVNLANYTKVTVAAGATVPVTIKVDKSALASYDADGEKSYLREAGDYYFSVGNGAHEAINNILLRKATNGVTIDRSKLTGNGRAENAVKLTLKEDKTTYKTSKSGVAITNQFDHADLNKVDADASNDIYYVSRQNWAGTMPEAHFTAESYQAAFQMAASDVIAAALKAGYEADTSTTFSKHTFGKDNGLKLIQFRGVGLDGSIEYNGKKYTWDDLVDQMSFAQMAKLIGVGFHNTAAVKSIEKPATHDENGAQGFTMSLVGGASQVSYPSEDLRAATFNQELNEKMGVSIGNSAYFSSYLYSGLYAPNANIHRTPYGGRNFEYFSEDPLLSGKALAGETRGIQSKGVYVYMKHFALNDQETGRDGISVWANEQAIRETYLKPFQIAIEEAQAHNVMTSFNRIGARWVGADKNLLTYVLKGEFGMDGMALTDYSNNSYMDVRMGLQAGSDIWDCSSTKWQDMLTNGYKSDAEMQTYMRRATKAILYTVVNSNAMNGYTSDTEIVETTPWWKPTLIALDVTFGVLTVASLGMLVFDIIRGKKNGEAAK